MKLVNGESLINVLSVTVLGILIVFAALIILMIVLNMMKLFAPSENKSEAKAKPTETVKTQAIEAEETDEDELIAVLTAAVAASLKTSTYNLKIRSYRRVK